MYVGFSTTPVRRSPSSTGAPAPPDSAARERAGFVPPEDASSGVGGAQETKVDRRSTSPGSERMGPAHYPLPPA